MNMRENRNKTRVVEAVLTGNYPTDKYNILLVREACNNSEVTTYFMQFS